MIQRVLKAGFLAGLVVGLAIAVLQHFTTSQLILQGEVYEKAAHHHHAALNSPALPIVLVHDHGTNAAASEPEEEEDEGWQPAKGWQRVTATSIATIATSIGYALILIAAMVAAGVPIAPRRRCSRGRFGGLQRRSRQQPGFLFWPVSSTRPRRCSPSR